MHLSVIKAITSFFYGRQIDNSSRCLKKSALPLHHIKTTKSSYNWDLYSRSQATYNTHLFFLHYPKISNPKLTSLSTRKPILQCSED